MGKKNKEKSLKGGGRERKGKGVVLDSVLEVAPKRRARERRERGRRD